MSNSQLINGIDLDGGIDWSSVKFPAGEEGEGKEEAGLLLLDNHSLLVSPYGQKSNTMTTRSIMNHSAIHLSQRKVDSSNNINETQYGNDHATRDNVITMPMCQGMINHGFTATVGEHAQDESQQTVLEMKRKIEHLEQTLADRDARLFDLESTMATVEAEASYQIQQSQVQLQQQLRACQDQLRQLEKDLDSKNQMIVKMKKRYRKEESPADLQQVSNNNVASWTNQTSKEKITVRKIEVNDESENIVQDNVVDDDDVNKMCVVEPSPSAIENFLNGHKRRHVIGHDEMGNRSLMQNRYDHRRSLTLDETYKWEETTRAMLHLVYFIERNLLLDTKTQCSILDRPQFSRHGHQTNDEKKNNNEPETVHCDESNTYLLDDTQEETDAVVQIRNHLLCLLQYCNLPEIYRNSKSLQEERKFMVYSQMNDKVNIALIAKEIIVIGASIQEKHTKRNENGGSFLDSCFPASLLCLLKEFCTISSNGRTCICDWLCRNTQQTHNVDDNDDEGSTKDASALSRIRGLPEEYREKVQIVHHVQNQMSTSKQDRFCHVNSWWNEDFDIQCDMFRKTFLSCVIGPNRDEYNSLSCQQRVRALALQTLGLECLCVIIQDASNSQLLVLYDIVINNRKQDSIGSQDIISVLERNTIASMKGIGHRHALIKEDEINQYTFPYSIDVGESPDIRLIKTKRKVLQFLSRLLSSTPVIHSLSKILGLTYYRDSVSNLTRIVAAILDDLQAVILPVLSSQDASVDLELSILQFVADIFHLLSLVSNCLEGFDLIRTQMSYFTTANTNPSKCSLGSSCVAMGVDILEQSTTQMLLYPTPTSSSQKDADVSSRKWLSLCKLVQTIVSFFYAIHSRRHVHSATSKSNKGKDTLLLILLDTNRYHSFTYSCLKIASFPESSHSLQLKAKLLLQSLADAK
jgi:hypothetical protein